MEIENHIFKDVKYFPSPNFNSRPNESDISLIVIHCISLPPKNYEGEYVKDFFLNKLNTSEHSYFKGISDLKVSSHLFIKRNGEIVQFVPFNKRAWHAGESSYKGINDCNNFSIGIELEGNVEDCYTDNQYESLINVTNTILNYYPNIDKTRIIGHSEIAPNRKTDPGKNFEWDKYLDSLT